MLYKPKNDVFKTFSNYSTGKLEYGILTLLNLKTVFPYNHALHDAIDGQFKSDISLTEFDLFHKIYKINHFLGGQGIK